MTTDYSMTGPGGRKATLPKYWQYSLDKTQDNVRVLIWHGRDDPVYFNATGDIIWSSSLAILDFFAKYLGIIDKPEVAKKSLEEARGKSAPTGSGWKIMTDEEIDQLPPQLRKDAQSYNEVAKGDVEYWKRQLEIAEITYQTLELQDGVAAFWVLMRYFGNYDSTNWVELVTPSEP